MCDREAWRAGPLLLFLLSCNFGLQSVDDGVVRGKVPGDSQFPEVNDGPIDLDLSGRLYSVKPSDMEVTEPAGLSAVKGQLFAHNLLIYVVDQAGSRLQLAMAFAGEDGQQNHCEVVRNLPVADWSDNPAFLVGPGNVATSFAGSPATFYDFRLYGVMSQDGTYWDRGVFDATLDLRELQAAIPGADCALVESYEGSCIACEDGEDQCFQLHLEKFKGTLIDGAFDPRETGDCQ